MYKFSSLQKYFIYFADLFKPAPRPRSLTRSKRELPETSLMINFGSHKLTVMDFTNNEEGIPGIITNDEYRYNTNVDYVFSDVEAMVEEVPLDYNDDFTYNTDKNHGENLTQSTANELRSAFQIENNYMNFSLIFAIGILSVMIIVLAATVITSKRTKRLVKKTATQEL